jgi:hypothetical protein
MLQPTADDDLVAAILDELRDKRRALKDPRHPSWRDPTALETYARAEVHRSIARGRRPENLNLPSAADLRQYLQAKRRLLLTDEARAAHDQMRIEPPPKYDASKWWAAAEAFDLIEQFSKKLPTGTGCSNRRLGSFQTISALLYEAVCNVPDANLQRACTAVLRARRGVLRGVPR